MFAAETKALIKNVGLQETLISNSDLNDKIDLLTLVKVSEGRFWQFPRYQKILWTLPDLIEEEEFSPEAEEEVLVKDFMTSVETSGSGRVEGGETTVGEVKASASADCTDGLVQPVSIQKTKANLRKMRKVFSGRTIKQEKMKMLKLKEKDKLTFVYQKVYNTGPVKLIKKVQYDGSISASCQKMLNLLIKSKRTEETSFTVPEKSTFAYGLMEVLLVDQKMEISLEPWTHKRPSLKIFSDSIQSEMMQQVREGIEMKETLLKPLKDLPESTRHDLMKKLQEVLEVQDGLAELEETLDQSSKRSFESPQSQVVSSFMDLMDVSQVSTAVRNSVQLLVSAMDSLLEVMQRPLTSCSPEALKVLVQMVDSLKENGEVRLPESLPVPLQEDGELRWVVELLCSSDKTLEDMGDIWDRPPEVLLEVLALTVLGLSLLQNID